MVQILHDENFTFDCLGFVLVAKFGPLVDFYGNSLFGRFVLCKPDGCESTLSEHSNNLVFRQFRLRFFLVFFFHVRFDFAILAEHAIKIIVVA